MENSILSKCLSTYSPISLDEMESVKLMNRVDTKFVCHESLLPSILSQAEEGYTVQEVAGKRIATYDTVYYDTSGLDMYLRHHDQQLVRRKVRVRTYVDTGSVFLEIKKKNNRGRTKKKRIAIQVENRKSPDLCAQRLEGDRLLTEFVAKHTPYEWSELAPKERTSFERVTLVNKGKTERLTIDFNLRFEAIGSGVKADLGPLVIIELKRDGLVPSRMQHILRDLRIFPMKISKYCMGVTMTIPEVKHNRFKEKLIKLNKLRYYA